MRNTKIAMLRDALEHLKRERRNVDAIVYERVRRAVCRRFPNFTYEQIIADIHNERKITGIKTVVRADIISSLNRKIAKATALLQVYERKNRKRKKRAITAPSPSATEQ